MRREKELQEQIIASLHRMKRAKLGEVLNNMAPQDFFILEMIERHPSLGEEGMYVSDLAMKLKVSSPAVSRRLGSLEERGLIKRNVDSRDRRNTCVHITEEGEKVRKEVCNRMENLTYRVIHNMGEENIEQMIHLWNRFSDEMEKEAEKMKKGE